MELTTNQTAPNDCAEQPSAADIMLMQAQGKEVPNRKPIQTNVQKRLKSIRQSVALFKQEKINLVQMY